MPLSRTEIMHFARRVGYSIKSLGLVDYLAPSDGIMKQLTLKEAIGKLLSRENLDHGLSQEMPSHILYQNRVKFWVIWSQESREKGNHWDTIGRYYHRLPLTFASPQFSLYLTHACLLLPSVSGCRTRALTMCQGASRHGVSRSTLTLVRTAPGQVGVPLNLGTRIGMEIGILFSVSVALRAFLFSIGKL